MKSQPSDLAEIGPLYANLMEEIKRRTDVIRRVLGGGVVLPQMAAFELCYIQLRKICEVFALACLCAHGDIPEVRSKLLQKSYSVDQIIKQLTALRKDFYPVPTNQELDPITGQPVRTVPIASAFLSKDELLELYGECGNYLHRGSIRQLLNKWEPALDFEKIRVWVTKIITLLNHHQIQIGQSDKQLWVLMHNKLDGKVYWSVMQKVGPAP
jgi:hypothetical protein